MRAIAKSATCRLIELVMLEPFLLPLSGISIYAIIFQKPRRRKHDFVENRKSGARVFVALIFHVVNIAPQQRKSIAARVWSWRAGKVAWRQTRVSGGAVRACQKQNGWLMDVFSTCIGFVRSIVAQSGIPVETFR